MNTKYNYLDRRIILLQAESTALYENDALDDNELNELVSPINAEILDLIDQLYSI